MLAFLTVLNSIFQTYVQSLKKDLGKGVFESIILIAVLSWIGLLLAAGLWVAGRFHLPSDPLFYLFWFALTFFTEITFTAFLVGMLSTSFFAASSLNNLSFVVTALYAALILGERYSIIQVIAICVAAAGTLLFFEKGVSKSYLAENKGLLLILFSLVLTPLEYIFYKSATLHTNAYDQFLTGRLVMDAVFYSLFFALVAIFWYRKNPFLKIRSLVSTYPGLTFLAGSTLAELLESWLIFKMPVGLFTVLGIVSIPAGYFIGQAKYQDKIKPRYVLGGLLIFLAVIFFIFPMPK